MQITKTSPTAEILAAMMVENTGRHFLDSGGAYGRGFQWAQAAVEKSGVSAAEHYLSRPRAYLGGFQEEVWPMVDAFHYLNETLDYEPELQELFESECDDSTPWMAEAEGFAERHGDGEIRTVNTYNHDTLFNETLQWVEFGADLDESGEDHYVLMQIHRGADVRGGYTKPRLFRVQDSDRFGDDAVTIGCDNWTYETTLAGEEIKVGCTYLLDIRGGHAEAMTMDGDPLDIENYTPVRPEGGDETEGYCAQCGNELWIEPMGS